MKHCVLLSGGYDCVAVMNYAPKDADLIFFEYGQLYLEQEREAVANIEARTGRTVKRYRLEIPHNAKARNFTFISYVVSMGYDVVWTGTRNVLPLFDKYKDSNWFTLKRFARILRARVRMPVVALPKSAIRLLAARIIPLDLIFSSENFKA